MTRFFYDLHVHSCLSPCADNDMTPNNIAGMAAVNGLNIIALTDHNSVANCRAFFDACRKNGIIPIPGMELTTAEDIHIICLFPSLEKAEDFGKEFYHHRILYKNKPEIFGDQLILDADDNIIGREDNLLINASDLSLGDATALAQSYDAAVYPAHIDRESNGIIAALGAFPEKPDYHCIEFNDSANTDKYVSKYRLAGKEIVTSSDAHQLWSINEAVNSIEIEDEPYSSAIIRQKLIDRLSGKGDL